MKWRFVLLGDVVAVDGVGSSKLGGLSACCCGYARTCFAGVSRALNGAHRNPS